MFVVVYTTVCPVALVMVYGVLHNISVCLLSPLIQIQTHIQEGRVCGL